MKLEKKDLVKYIFIGLVLLVVFIFVVKLLGNNKVDKKLNVNKTSSNYVVDDNIVMSLYDRFNPERGIMFNLVGSDIYKKYYGYYYKSKNIKYSDLNDLVKSVILINDADYKTGEYNKELECYYMSKSNYGIIYEKIFGDDKYKFSFDEKFVPNIIDNDDNICIKNNSGGKYTKVIDTYMVNAISDKKYISIYERVAFIKITDDYLYYYKDVDMKDLVYKLEITNKLDMSFVNDHNVVSNVLLKYQDEFDLYEYKYKKGVDSYYFESISR